MKKRKVKFRAWDDLHKEWLLGYELPNVGGFSMMGEVMAFGEWSKVLSDFKIDDWDKIILMQYTGLKDKAGKEIYEGDICSGHSDGNGVITWTDFDGGYDYIFNDGNNVGIWEVKKDILVIGNIFNNPELTNTIK